VKRAIDDKISAARRAGNIDDARIFQGIKSGIVENLDTLNPAFRQARAAFRGPTESVDAIETGRGFLTMPPEQISKAMAAMAPADRDFARLGAARSLQDLTGAATDRTRQLLSPNMQRRFQAIFPDQQTYEATQKAWQIIRRQQEVNRRVLSGSQTYENFAQAGDAQLDPGVLLHAAHGNILGASVSALRGLGNRLGGITPKVADRGARLLLSTDPAEQQAALLALRSKIGKRIAAPGRIGAIQRAAVGGVLGDISQR